MDASMQLPPFDQLRRVTSILGLLSRHQDDARLQALIDNLWLDGQLLRTRMNPGAGLAPGPVPGGDRWPSEIPGLYVSHLTSRPVWPSDDICQLLERHVEMFQEEFAGIDPSHYQVDARDHVGGLTDGRNWTVFPFYDGSGNLLADNARQCPGVAEFLRGHTGVGGIGCMAFFSIMDPKTHVPPHTSNSNTRVRYHLGIDVPQRDAYLRIHDQQVTWKQDRCIKIDDSYEHEVFQNSDRRRVVFVLDLPHPDLRAEEIEFLQQFMSYTTGVGLPRS